MLKKILICLDNSAQSNSGADLGLAIARFEGAAATGCHVYAANLHNDRFRQMEAGLPPQYQDTSRLKDQREVHDTLISKGLRIISDSYNDVFLTSARTLGVEADAISREGKNFEELIKEAASGGYDLLVIGSSGLGKTRDSETGSVCARVARMAPCDTLISRVDTDRSGSIIVAIDGSTRSFGGLLTAIELSKAFGGQIEAISAYDTDYHRHAFRSLGGVLSDEAGRLFRFSEQERLHEEVIDKGLGRIYQDHLDTASMIAKQNSVTIKTTLLEGKPSDVVIRHVEEARPFLFVLGKTGAHESPSLDIGSLTERSLQRTSCNLLISSRRYDGEAERAASGTATGDAPVWEKDATSILDSIPLFARGVVRLMVEDAARKDGVNTISPAFMRKIRKNMEG
ncbi:MAG: universal stress protein [Deltaproteobacteria bacterium]